MSKRSDTPGILQAAHEYAERGLPIIPLIGKVPALKGWQTFIADAANRLLYYGERGCNIGLRTGRESGYVVVDTDSQRAEEWVQNNLLPPTPMQARSGAGSTHNYLAVPPEIEIRNKQGWNGIQGLDIRSEGGYIVLPPSIHPLTGKPYRWLTEILSPEGLPRFQPVWVQEQTRRRVQQEVMSPDASFRELRASRWLETVEGAVSGSGGHNATFRVACKLVHFFSLDYDTAIRLMLSIFNPRCEPPWDENALAHKVTDAIAKGRSPS